MTELRRSRILHLFSRYTQSLLQNQVHFVKHGRDGLEKLATVIVFPNRTETGLILKEGPISANMPTNGLPVVKASNQLNPYCDLRSGSRPQIRLHRGDLNQLGWHTACGCRQFLKTAAKTESSFTETFVTPYGQHTADPYNPSRQSRDPYAAAASRAISASLHRSIWLSSCMPEEPSGEAYRSPLWRSICRKIPSGYSLHHQNARSRQIRIGPRSCKHATRRAVNRFRTAFVGRWETRPSPSLSHLQETSPVRFLNRQPEQGRRPHPGRGAYLVFARARTDRKYLVPRDRRR